MCGEWHGSCHMTMLCHSCLNYTHNVADDGIVFRAHTFFFNSQCKMCICYFPIHAGVCVCLMYGTTVYSCRRIGFKELWAVYSENLIRDYQSMVCSRFTTGMNSMTHLSLQKYMAYVWRWGMNLQNVLQHTMLTRADSKLNSEPRLIF